MDRSSKLDVSADATSITLREWDTVINLFDSTNDVTVQRLDITGSPNSEVSLYSESSPLQLTSGPIYFFHNATKLVLKDMTNSTYSLKKSDAVLWASKGSCLQINAQLSSDGEASLLAVTSGKVPWRGADEQAIAHCGKSTVLVGAGLSTSTVSGGGWIYNQVKYNLTDSASCTNPLTHGQWGYSQTDEPIGPLAAHYHTRGALYYNQYGTSKYNDEASPNDVLYQGELRFVNSGVHYGPEEMDQSTTFVASVHETDPVSIDPVGENPTSECPFACMNTLNGKSPARCVKTSGGRVFV